MGRIGKRSIYVGKVVFTIIWLAGCATLSLPTGSERIGTEGILGSCADFFASYDKTVAAARVMDAGTFRVDGYPYLRSDRFLSSFGREVYDPIAFSDWIDRMQALDREARQCEIANLTHMKQSDAEFSRTLQKMADCGDLLKREDFADSRARQQLRKTIEVPDEYIEARRVVGIYPLTGWFVSRGVRKWHDEARKTFSLEPPPNWQNIIRYSPPQSTALPSSERIAALVERDALGIPKYTDETLDALFAIHAPLWELETMGDEDRIGEPVWGPNKALTVDIKTPVTYTLVNFTRFKSKVLTQLNYVIWFPARPKTGALDIYGGQLDGINYRVTLDVNGSPLLYETIHNCGCYYKAYPTKQLKVRAKIDYAEPPLIFKAPSIDPNAEIMVVAAESRTHYVQHLYARPRQMRPEKVYRYSNYNILRSLSLPESGRKSMFGPDGVVPGTQRLERFLLWPTGVLSPGSMRQWGRQAVTLLGKRHFDDPYYIEKVFKQHRIEE